MFDSFFSNATLIALSIVLPIVALLLGAFVGIVVFRVIQGKKIESSRKSADKILAEAVARSQAVHKEAQLRAQEEVLKLREGYDKEKQEAEKDFKDRRVELSQAENRIRQKEESIDKKLEIYDKKLESIEQAKDDLKKERVI